MSTEATWEWVPGADLVVGDVIECWWQPGHDTITSLVPYKGPLESSFPFGARLAEFAINRSGMTVENDSVNRRLVRAA